MPDTKRQVTDPADLELSCRLVDSDADLWHVTEVSPQVVLCFRAGCGHGETTPECRMPFDAVNERYGPLFFAGADD